MKKEVIRYFQKGFNFSQDGPGNRLVYHLYGCNFRCPWCSNPECFAPDTRISEQTADETVDEILRSRPMFFSGGGVTFTGGEATLQFDALKEILSRVREAGIHTAIECNASHPRLPELFPFVDDLILDFKHPDPEWLRERVGADGKTVLANLRTAIETRQVMVRIPLIRGYNTDSATVDGFLAFLLSLKRRSDFSLELISYHEYGKVKWKQHGMDYRVNDGFLLPGETEQIRDRFCAAGIPLVRT